MIPPRMLDAVSIFQSAQFMDFDEAVLRLPVFDPFHSEMAEAFDAPADWDAACLSWPDGSIGFAMLPPDEAARAVRIVLTYTKARAALEKRTFLALQPTEGEPRH